MPASQNGPFCAVCATSPSGLPDPAPFGKSPGLRPSNIAWDRGEVFGRDSERGEPQGPSLFAARADSKLGSVPLGEPLSLSLPQPVGSEVSGGASDRASERDVVYVVRTLEGLSAALLDLAAEWRAHVGLGVSALREPEVGRRVQNLPLSSRKRLTPKSREDVS